MHQSIASREQKFSSKLVNRVCITEDVICLLEGFTITAINQKPSREDLVDFAASYFEEIRKKRDLLAERGIGNFRTGLYLSSEWNGQVWHARVQEAWEKSIIHVFQLNLKRFSSRTIFIQFGTNNGRAYVWFQTPSKTLCFLRPSVDWSPINGT